MSDDESQIVWSDSDGDLRKNSNIKKQEEVVESNLLLKLRRLTTGKGRTIIEISNLPANKKWCQKLAKEMKRGLGVGGTYKNDNIEVHGEKLEAVKSFLLKKNLKYKQVGG